MLRKTPEFYDTLHRAQMEVGFRPTRIVDGLVESVRNAVSLFMICGLLFSFDWALTMVVLLAVVPDFLILSKYGHILHRWRLDRTEEERRAWLFHWMLTVSYHAKEIRIYNLGGLLRARFRDLREKIRQERHRIFLRRGVAELVTEALSTTAFFTAYAIIAYKCVYGTLTLGDLVMYHQSFQYAQEYFQGMMRSLAGLYEDNLFLSSLYQFLALKRKVVPTGRTGTVPAPVKTGVVFERVSFRYPGTARFVVEDVSLTMQPGRIVALVGENGSGKTTLVKLLCRFYDPEKGKVTIDGADLRELEPEDHWQDISAMFQDHSKYPVTARDNIWYGAVDRHPDEGRHHPCGKRRGSR